MPTRTQVAVRSAEFPPDLAVHSSSVPVTQTVLIRTEDRVRSLPHPPHPDRRRRDERR